jgi:glycine hydroxymethyltransferase
VTLNRNAIPFDPNGPWYTSGLRVGTPAVTTLGMGAPEMRKIADVMKLVLSSVRPGDPAAKPGARSPARYALDEAVVAQASGRVRRLLDQFPLYPEIDLDLLLETVPVSN